MLRRRILAAATATVLALGMSVGGAGAALANPNAGVRVCEDFSTGHLTDNIQDGVVEYTAPEGKLVSAFCVKAGSANQGEGPEVTLVDPPQKTVTIDHSTKDSISHYSVQLVDEPPAEPGVVDASIAFVAATCDDQERLDRDAFAFDPAVVSLVDWSDDGDTYSVEFAALGNNVFEDTGASGREVSDEGKTLTLFGSLAVQLTGEECDDVQPLPASAALAFIDPTCDSAQSLADPTSFDTVGVFSTEVTVNGLSYEVVFTAELGYLFPAGEGVDENGFTLTLTGELDPALTGEECEEDVEPLPASASVLFLDPTCDSAQGLADEGTFPVTGATVSDVVVDGLSYSVTFEASEGYAFIVDGESTSTLVISGTLDPALTGVECDFDLPTQPLVEPNVTSTQATCAASGSYTLSNTEGVQWVVNGENANAGTYTAAPGSSVSIEAIALEGFGFGFETQTEWELEFAAVPTNCDDLDLPTLALTGASGMLGSLGIAAFLIILTGIGVVATRRRVEV